MPVKKVLEKIIDLETSARVLPAGVHLYRQGDHCRSGFVVLSGWLAQSVLLEDGSCQILDFALPDTVFAFAPAGSTLMYHSAYCLSLARVCAIPLWKLDQIIESNPDLTMLLWRQVAASEVRAHDHLTNLGLRGARERIAHLLLELYIRLRRKFPTTPDETVELPLSQGHIGQALGLTYVHVCRSLQILREQGVVSLANHKLQIIDPAALIAVAGVHLEEHSPKTGAARADWSAHQDTPGLVPAGWAPFLDGPARPGFPPGSSADRFGNRAAA
jgi:CRP/FNR family transcriptional regulator